MIFARMGPKRAFTLIEILVAMVIFAILVTSLFASFRTGMQAFTMATEHADQQQLGRYAINQVAQDLRNIYYKPESQYNVARRQQEALLDEQNANARRGSGRQDVIDENLPDLGPPVDLSFTGMDNGDIDQLSLVRIIPYSPENPTSMWGLARVTYYVIDGKFYRAVDDVTTPEADEEGYVLPKLNDPRVEKLADNCVGFDLKYGYYHEERWEMADSWDSSAAVYRNPMPEEDDDVLSTLGSNRSGDVQSEGAGAALQQTLQQQEQQMRSDDLPGWIELTFKFANDPERPDNHRTYKQTIVLNHKYAMETYTPEDEEDQLRGARANSRSRRPSERSSENSSSGSNSGERRSRD